MSKPCRSRKYYARVILDLCFSIVTVDCISSYKLVNAKNDNESDPTCIIESTPPKR